MNTCKTRVHLKEFNLSEGSTLYIVLNLVKVYRLIYNKHSSCLKRGFIKIKTMTGFLFVACDLRMRLRKKPRVELPVEYLFYLTTIKWSI